MSPQQAVDIYRRYLMPFSNRASLGAPAVTNGPSGLKWLRDFLYLCNGCKVDFVPIHWYDRANNPDYFKRYIEEANRVAHSQPGNRDLWLTEVHSSNSPHSSIPNLYIPP